MIVLIGGESHVGKTCMAQNLLEKYKVPYISIDHIKMGLIRSDFDCGFTALDSTEKISNKLFGIVKGIIDTCIENKQNNIIEGCYLPPKEVEKLDKEQIIAVYIIFSKEYINKNFNQIIEFENLVETRKFPCDIEKKSLIKENEDLKKECIDAEMPYFEIKYDYEEEIQQVYRYIHSKVYTVEKYKSEDINEIINLFYNTVREINKKDYTKEQIKVWANKDLDKKKWNESFLQNNTVVVKIFNKIVGFGDINKGYLDRLYVHKDFQGIGIGKFLVEELEKSVREDRIETHASITAVPFFKKMGYKVVKKQNVKRKNTYLVNFIMEKYLE